MQLVEASEPRAAELRDAVVAALETVDYERVDTLLAEAEAIEFEAMQQLLEALGLRVLEAAAIYPEAATSLEHGSGPRRRSVEHCCIELAAPALAAFCSSFPGAVSVSGTLGIVCASGWPTRLVSASGGRNHPLCDDDRFCKKRPDHPLCDDDPPPSPS